jgi:hypothetical protein
MKKISLGLICVLMFIVLLILKLGNVIAWSWWLITLPLWFFPGLIIGIAILAFVLIVLVAVLNY